MGFRTVTIEAPSRLHFGLMSFGGPAGQLSFGGVGLMVDRPGLRLTVRPAKRLAVSGPMADRVQNTIETWSRHRRKGQTIPVELHVDRAPAPHVGLGSGTQLVLSVVRALEMFHDEVETPIESLAAEFGRAKRSAIGTYGFKLGGFIMEHGRREEGVIAPLACHYDVPTEWQFVLFRPIEQQGLSGAAEQDWFAKATPVSAETTRWLREKAEQEMVPALERRDVDAFGEAVYEYGLRAGACFSGKLKGGSFATPTLARWVSIARELGVRGIGQSSWGPTLFAILPDANAARRFAEQFVEAARVPADQLRIEFSPANPSGATCVVEDD
ncbi:MAG: hypothetical protein R3E01_02940 [Pirellulaceae bacterium]|nr:hypothetical protein [Planctomycetales bacterium]